MKLNRLAAGAVMAGTITSAAFGIGAGIAQADPNGPNVPGPNVPGPNVPGPNGPDVRGPGQLPPPGEPICNGGPGVNCNRPGTPLPPGQGGLTPPPGHYNDPGYYGLPARWTPPGQPGDYPLVYNPAANAWGVFTANGQFVAYGTGANGDVNAGTGVGTGPAT